MSRRWPRRRERRALVGRCGRQRAEVFPELLRRGVPIDIVTDQTSAHDPLSYLPVGIHARGLGRVRGEEAGGVHRPGPGRRWPSTSRRWSDSWTPAPRCSTTATRSATRPGSAASSGRSISPASCPPTSGRCSARARARSAGRRCPATRRHRRHRPGGAGAVPRQRSAAQVDARRPGAGRVPGPAGADLLAGLRRAGQGRGCGSTTWWRPARCQRADRHRPRPSRLRLGRQSRTGRPRRWLDGSDAIADWPLLNAMVNTASGASWVSIHHGGGVGIGRSIHAGQVSRRRRHRAGRAEARAGADQRPRDGRDPACRRGLRPRATRSRPSAACGSRCRKRD